MKREITMKVMLVLVAVFATSGLFAQTPVPGYSDGSTGNNYENAGATYVTVDKAVPLYAEPSSYYHPGYDPEIGDSITPGFTWTWTSANAPADISFGAANANYIELTGNTVGSYTINVVENSPWGGCTDAGTNLTINVVDTATIDFVGTLSSSYEDCENGTFPAAIEAVIARGYQNYRFAWSLEIKTYDSDGDSAFYATDKSSILGTSGELAVDNGYDSPQAAVSSGNVDITTVGGAEIYQAIGGNTTVYTYTLNGINDQASRWGDFLTLAGSTGVNGATADQFVYYDTAPKVLTVTVHPTPTTGPIFHINSNWAN